MNVVIVCYRFRIVQFYACDFYWGEWIWFWFQIHNGLYRKSLFNHMLFLKVKDESYICDHICLLWRMFWDVVWCESILGRYRDLCCYDYERVSEGLTAATFLSPSMMVWSGVTQPYPNLDHNFTERDILGIMMLIAWF